MNRSIKVIKRIIRKWGIIDGAWTIMQQLKVIRNLKKYKVGDRVNTGFGEDLIIAYINHYEGTFRAYHLYTCSDHIMLFRRPQLSIKGRYFLVPYTGGSEAGDSRDEIVEICMGRIDGLVTEVYSKRQLKIHADPLSISSIDDTLCFVGNLHKEIFIDAVNEYENARL